MVWLKTRNPVEDDPSSMFMERAPPVRVVAIITLICSTLDVFADIIMCIKFASLVQTFNSKDAINAVYCYYFFTAVSVIIYFVEVVDIVITLKNNQENRILTPLVKSLIICLEEVPLPVCLYIIYKNEPSVTLANPMLVICCIKLVALIWGIMKFMKIKFCWPFLPCLLDHGFNENVRRCCRPTLHKMAMLFVNCCHAFSIVIVLINIINVSKQANSIHES